MSTDRLTVPGVVEDSCHGLTTVRVDIGGRTMLVRAKLSGKMHWNRVHVVAGDHVVLELSPFDPARGRIISRRDNRAA